MAVATGPSSTCEIIKGNGNEQTADYHGLQFVLIAVQINFFKTGYSSAAAAIGRAGAFL